MNIIEAYEKIVETVKEMETREIIYLHNSCCGEWGDIDNYVYSMEEFDEIMGSQKPCEIASACFYGDFCPARDWFTFDGYGNCYSFDFLCDNSGVDICNIAEYMIEFGESFNNADIQAILDEYDI